MKIPLTIKVDYLPGWGAYEGIRELLQNGQDAKVEFGATFEVRYRKDTQTLVIENEGCTLPHEALLLGHTSKADRSALIGKFGEGLKLGVLALVRAGHAVKIRSGSEVWVPSIQQSDQFNARVLVFTIVTGRRASNRVCVEVGGIEPEVWETMRGHFLFLSPDDALSVRTSSGTLLLDPAKGGCIYVKGIHVQRAPTRYGYDLADTEVDRDRKMISQYDLEWAMQHIWREALIARPDLVGDFAAMLDQQRDDVAGLSEWNAKNLPDAAKAEIVRVFQERHGDTALPVAGLSDSKDLEHLGRKGVVTPKPLKAVLEAVLGTLDDAKKNLRTETVRQHSWGDLSDAEKANLERAIGLIAAVRPGECWLRDVDVVDFRDEKLEGLYKDARVQVAQRVLTTRRGALLVLVHEFAHKITGGAADGTKEHVAAIEALWADIVEGGVK